MIDRRRFIAAVAASGFAPRLAWSNEAIRPQRLRPGDRVGLVRPATAVGDTMDIEIMADALDTLGFDVVAGDNYFARHGYLGGTDEQRAADINAFFADDTIRMIVASGGWGGARLLPRIDYEAIRRDPKVFLGYSDVTSLLTAIYAKTGLVTFHAPAPLNNYSADWFRRVVMEGERVTMRNPDDVTEDTLVQTENRIRTIQSGKATGRMLGGNLTVLTTIIGSEYLPDFSDAILFVEDVNEQIYRIDRMLTQLSLAGILGRIAGFVFGRCTECDPGENYGALTLEQVIREHIEPLGIPAYQGAMIGHIKQQFTVPIGSECEIDADAGTIRMLEAAVG